jgi:Zn-dependent M32 family carboxypeptidase
MRPVHDPMSQDSHDPRDIPILTEEAEPTAEAEKKDDAMPASLDVKAVHAALVTETLNLADSLLHRAAKDIEAALFERVFDQLRAQLPELVDRVLREHAAHAEHDARAEHDAHAEHDAAGSPAETKTDN